MFRSARIKLTAWYLLIIMLVSISFSVAMYRVLTSELDRLEQVERVRIQRRMPELQLPISPGGRPVFLDPDVLAETKNRVELILILINLIILAGSAYAGYILAGRTLNPIKEMVDEQNRFITDASHELRTPLTSLSPKVKMSIIPFPCHPPFHGAQREARIRLGLPLDRKIIFAYGFNIIFNHVDLFPVMEKLSKDYPLSLLLLTHHDPTTLETKPEFLIFRDEMPSDDRLYEYLHASDAYLYHGRECAGVGVSSSTATCFGAGRPVVVSTNCNFFDLSGKEVIKYNNMPELEQRLRDVFESAGYVKESLNAAEEYATKNSGAEIAKQFIGLLSEVLGEQVHAQTTSRK